MQYISDFKKIYLEESKMSVSYFNACSQSVQSSSCFFCLNRLESSKSRDAHNPGWNIVGLPQCKHLIHQSCFNHWTSHSRELARRDVRVEDQATCPLCKVKVKVNENEAFHNVDDDIKILNYNHPDPDPEFPLPLSETPDPDSHYDIQSLQALFDQAVSVERSDYYFNVSNFPALHQMKNRYGITLSAEQLDKILNEALLTTLFKNKCVIVDASALGKIKMAMLIRSDNDASKEVINNFLKRVLDVEGYCKDVAIDFLLEQEIADKDALQKVFEYQVKKKDFDEAEELHKKHGLHIGYEVLKQALMQASSKSDIEILSKIADSKNFQLAVLEALKSLNEKQIDFERHCFAHIKRAINLLLGTGISDQSEVSKSLRLAVLADDQSWKEMLQKKYGAVLDPQFFKEQLEGTEDSDLVDKVFSLYKLRANDEVSTTALIAALMRVVTANHDFCSYPGVEKLLTKCLNAGIFSQQLVNTALTQALDADRDSWAKKLNKSFQAVLDPQILKDYLWKKLANCPSSMSSMDEGEFISCIQSILSFADKENQQSNEAVRFVLDRLLGDTNLSQRPSIKRCIKLLEQFNDDSTGSPKPKRKK